MVIYSSKNHLKVVGFTTTGSICTGDKYSLVEEKGGLINIVIAAQQLAINLGASYDGLDENHEFGNKFSSYCKASDNYLMSSSFGQITSNLKNTFKLSVCSILSIKSNLLSKDLM